MYKIDELLAYEGRGIKPQNFDLFWDKALEEMHALPLNYHLEQIHFPSKVAKAYHLTFEGLGGAIIHCQLLTPIETKGRKFKGMLQFHGYHTDSGDFSDKVGLVAEGFVVLSMDARGQGGPSNDVTRTQGGVMKGLIIRGIDEGEDNLYYKYVYLDTAHTARILMSLEYVDNNLIYAQGASQGGGLTIACASLVPEIHKVLVSYPFLSDFRKAYEMGAETSAFEEIPYWFRFRDPLHKKEEKFFSTLEYIDLQHLAPRVKAEVLWAIGMKDEVVPPITQFATYNKLSTTKNLIILPEYGHEYLPRVGDETRSFFFE